MNNLPPQLFSRRAIPLALLPSLMFVSACAWLPRKSGFDEVRTQTAQRTGFDIQWNRGDAEEHAIHDQVRVLLAGEFNADNAARIALLNNRHMQAAYQRLGIAQADVVQAGLLPNPIFDMTYKGSTEHMDDPELELGATIGFVEILTMPLRRKIAADQFEAVKLDVTQQVLALAAETRAQFYIVQADEQMLEMHRTIVEATSDSVEVARRLHDAGNIRALDLDNESALDAEARLDLASAELTARKNRERLNILMGLWGADAALQISTRLPDIPAEELPAENIEARVVEANLDLAILRRRLLASGRALGLTRATAFVPEVHLGGEFTRTSNDTSLWGPKLSLPLPLFDQGQPRVNKARAELRHLQQEFYYKAVETRAAARAARDHLQLARDRAAYTRDVLLPLQHRILGETQLEYNAMQVGVFDLLSAKRGEIAAGKRYIEDLRDYWLSRTEMESLISGHVTSVGFETTALDSTMGSALH